MVVRTRLFPHDKLATVRINPKDPGQKRVKLRKLVRGVVIDDWHAVNSAIMTAPITPEWELGNV